MAKINWTVTYQGAGPQPIAELFDLSNNLVQSTQVFCVPPIACPFPMDNIQFGSYKAAISSGSSRYYYIQGQDVITAPNDPSVATVITLNQQNSVEQVKIRVQV